MDPPERARATPPRRWPWVLAGTVALVALLVAAALAWLGSEAALRYVLDEAVRRSDGRIAIAGARGSLLSTVHLDAFSYTDPEKAVAARDVTFAWSPLGLLSRELRVRELGAATLEVRLGTTSDKSQLPESLALPLRVVLDRAHVGLLDVRAGAARWPIRDIHFGYRGGADLHQLRDIGLRAEQGTVTGELELAAHRPFDVRGRFRLEGTPAFQSPRLDVLASGTLEALLLEASGGVAQAAVTAHAALAPFADVPLQRVDVTVRDLDLHRVDARLPMTALAVELHGEPVPDGILAGNLTALNAAPGRIDADRIPVVRLASNFVLSKEAFRASGLDVALAGGGTIRGDAAVQLADGATGASDWALALRDVDLKALHGRLVPTRLSGTVEAKLRDGVEQVHAAIRQADMALETDARIAGTKIDLQRFALAARGGTLRGRAAFDWSGARAFALDATAERFDPSHFGDFPSASLNGSIDAKGVLQPVLAIDGALTIAATSRLRGVPVSGSVQGGYAPNRVRNVRADLVIAGGTLHADGDLGRIGDRLRVGADAPRIEDWLGLLGEPAQASGALRVAGELTGTFDGLGADLEVHGARLRANDNTVAALDGRVRVAAGPGYSRAALQARDIRLQLHAGDAIVDGRSVQRADATLAGTLGQHDLALAVQAPDLDLDLAARGGLRAATTWDVGQLAWSGTLNRLENRGTYAVRLEAPTTLAASRTHVAVGDARLALPEGRVNIASFDWTEGRITSRGDFTGLPVTAIARLSGASLPARTTLVLGGDWDVAATPRLNGSVHVRRERGDVFAATGELLDQPELALGLTTLEVAATFHDDAVDAKAELRATRVGTITADVSVGAGQGPPGRLAMTAALRGNVQAELASLRAFQPFLGTNALVDGALRADLALGGTVGAPVVTGALRGTGMRIDAPQYGVVWRDGVLTAHADANTLTIDEFSVAGGEGRFRISGTIPMGVLRDPKAHPGEAHVAWRAEHFRATNRPDLRLVTTGSGSVGFSRGRVSLRGDIQIDEGRIEFGQRAGTKLGDDVVVVGRERPAPQRRFEDVPLDLALDVDLGTRLVVQGSGLRTTLEGKARFATTTGGTLTAHGTLRTVHGTYQAFGQQLSIDRGQLVFDGPIDNPSLDIVALRKNLPVEAGVELTGTVRLPRVRLTSNPPVSDGEKLSWLVLGQGLDRTSGTDIAALQAAAGALFGSSGPSIGTRVAQRIGLDDLSIRSSSGTPSSGSSGLNSQVLAFSKRITDRLYVVYEAGLEIAHNALRVEYALSRSFTLRVQAGTVSSLGLYFLRAYP